MNTPVRVYAAVIAALMVFPCTPAPAQDGLGDMKNPYAVAERAAACLSAYRQSATADSAKLANGWSHTLRYAGAWAAQYGYSLRDLHLASARDTAGCETDIASIKKSFGPVITDIYEKSWKTAREANHLTAPVLEESGLKALSQAAWCAQALTTGAQAIEDAPESFGFSIADADGKTNLTKATILYRMNAQIWGDRTAALAPSGSYSAMTADQAHGAFLSWNTEFSTQQDQSFWLSFLANEITACDALGRVLATRTDDP